MSQLSHQAVSGAKARANPAPKTGFKNLTVDSSPPLT
jgi:hypothetical protein